jgi:hypothetical protein
MRFLERVEAALTLAAFFVVAPYGAHEVLAQVPNAQPIVDRVARDAPVEILIVLGAVAVTVIGMLWLNHKQAIRYESARSAEIAQFNATIAKKDQARDETLDKFTGLVEKGAGASEKIALALERLQDAIVNDRDIDGQMRGEIRAAISENKAALTEIRSALVEVREAQRAKGGAR